MPDTPEGPVPGSQEAEGGVTPTPTPDATAAGPSKTPIPEVPVPGREDVDPEEMARRRDFYKGLEGKDEAGSIGKADKTGSTGDEDIDELRKEHPKLLTKDEALDIADESKKERSDAAYYRGEAKLQEDEDNIFKGGNEISPAEAIHRIAIVNHDRKALMDRHGVTRAMRNSPEGYREDADAADRLAERQEDWALVLRKNPELAEEGWDVYRLTEEENRAARSREYAEFVKSRAGELRGQLEAGEVSLADVVREVGNRDLFGQNIDPVLNSKLRELLLRDKTRTIADVESDFLAEVGRAVESHEATAKRREARIAGLAQGKLPTQE